MSDEKTSTCRKCGTSMVPSKEKLKLDGSLPLDGSWNTGDMVCPKCHPELADTNQ